VACSDQSANEGRGVCVKQDKEEENVVCDILPTLKYTRTSLVFRVPSPCFNTLLTLTFSSWKLVSISVK
jgi:hypothetical protein